MPQIMKGDVDGFVGEQIGAVPVPQIWEPLVEGPHLVPQERVQNCVPEQILDSSVPQLFEVVVEVTPQERVQNPFPEQVVGVPVPQLMEAFAEVIPQERVLNRTQEQIVGAPLPLLMEAVVEVTPQECVLHCTQEQIAVIPVPQVVEECVQNRTLKQTSRSLVPQTMESVMEVVPPIPQDSVQNREQIVHSLPRVREAVAGVVRATLQERVQNGPRKLFVDVPVPHIMELSARKVHRTGKVFIVLHHRDDQACTVDTLGFNIKGLDKYTMLRSGDVMVPALHMEVPVPQVAEDIVERLVTRERIIERFGHSITWDSLEATLPPGLFRRLRQRGFEEEEEEEQDEEEDEEQGEILASS